MTTDQTMVLFGDRCPSLFINSRFSLYNHEKYYLLCALSFELLKLTLHSSVLELCDVLLNELVVSSVFVKFFHSYFRILAIAGYLVPWHRFSYNRREYLRAMGKDPLRVKKTKVKIDVTRVSCEPFFTPSEWKTPLVPRLSFVLFQNQVHYFSNLIIDYQ